MGNNYETNQSSEHSLKDNFSGLNPEDLVSGIKDLEVDPKKAKAKAKESKVDNRDASHVDANTVSRKNVVILSKDPNQDVHPSQKVETTIATQTYQSKATTEGVLGRKKQVVVTETTSKTVASDGEYVEKTEIKSTERVANKKTELPEIWVYSAKDILKKPLDFIFTTDLLTLKNYFKDPAKRDLALQWVAVVVLNKAPSSEKFDEYMQNMGISDIFTLEEKKDFYTLLTSFQATTKSEMESETGRLQIYLSKASQQLAHIIHLNWGIDKKMWPATVLAEDSFLKWFSKAELPYKDIEITKIEEVVKAIASRILEETKTTEVVEIKNPLQVRFELSSIYSSKKEISMDEIKNSIFIPQRNFLKKNIKNMDPFVDDTTNPDELFLRWYDNQPLMRFDKKTNSLFVYSNVVSNAIIFDPNTYKNTFSFQAQQTVTENRDKPEIKYINVDSLERLTQIDTWKWDVLNYTRLNMSLLWWALKFRWAIDMTPEDAAEISHWVEKEFDWFGEWYDDMWENDFKTRYSSWKWYFKKLLDMNHKFSGKIDKDQIMLTLDPYKFLKSFHSIGWFDQSLEVIQQLWWSIWPVSFDGNSLNDIADILNDVYDNRNDLDMRNKKWIEFWNLMSVKITWKTINWLATRLQQQAWWQLNVEKDIQVRSAIERMMVDGTDVELLGNWNAWKVEKDLNATALVRLAWWLFAFASVSNDTVYITPFRNHYNLAALWMKDIKNTQVWLAYTQNFIDKNWWKLDGNVIAKYMSLSWMNSENIVLNVPVWEVEVGNLVEVSDKIDKIGTLNGYVWVKLTKEWKLDDNGSTYIVSAEGGVSWWTRKKLGYNESQHKAEMVDGWLKWIGIDPSLIVKWQANFANWISFNGEYLWDLSANNYYKLWAMYDIVKQYDKTLTMSAFVSNLNTNQFTTLLNKLDFNPTKGKEYWWSLMYTTGKNAVSVALTNQEFRSEFQRAISLFNGKLNGSFYAYFNQQLDNFALRKIGVWWGAWINLNLGK
jgi:uncharacterized protein YeaO (DUF488 family)